MDSIKVSVPVQVDKQSAFNVLKDPQLLPDWSSYIHQVEKSLDGTYIAYTSFGPFSFDWLVDERGFTVTMRTYIMGYHADSIFRVVDGENSASVIIVSWPYDPLTLDEYAEMSKEAGEEEIKRLVDLIEQRVNRR